MYQPPDPASYFSLVWEIVEQIPEGYVASYGQIASMIPPPESVDPEQYDRLAARWVGSAMNAVKDRTIPWQRVINSQGKISFPKGSSSAEQQRALLEMEGVEFDDQEKVDFEVVGWDGPPDDWLRSHGLIHPRSLKKKRKSQNSDSQPSLF